MSRNDRSVTNVLITTLLFGNAILKPWQYNATSDHSLAILSNLVLELVLGKGGGQMEMVKPCRPTRDFGCPAVSILG